jgi:hypothetical protein
MRRYPSACSRGRGARSDNAARARAVADRDTMRMRPAAAMSWRCQRSSVSGLTGKPDQAARGSERLSAASSAQSARVSFGCRACRRSIVSSWRSTRILSSFERRGRASSQTSVNRFRTARYANDQSKQPSLDHDSKSAEPRQLAVGESPDGFANPTRGAGVTGSSPAHMDKLWFQGSFRIESGGGCGAVPISSRQVGALCF